MEQAGDVERLFAWLKSEDIRYREFAAAREVSDAVGAWPTLHKVAAETGHAGDIAAPEGDTAAKERTLREALAMPPAPDETPKAGTPTAGQPLLPGGRLRSALGRRMRTAERAQAGANRDGSPRAAFAAATSEAEDAAARERARAAAERLRERLDAAMAVNPRPAASEGGAALHGRDDGPPAAARHGLFGGAYRGFDEAPPAEVPQPARTGGRGHSLQSIFARLAAGGRTLPDPRERGRSAPAHRARFDRPR